MKKTGLKVCSAVFALCVAFGVSNVISASADDTPVYVENGVAVNGFYVENGAAVHLGATTTGMRYSTVVTDAFKSYLSTTYADATFEWHTLITGVNMLEGGDVSNVTPDLKKPEWVGANAGQAACVDFERTLSTLVADKENGIVADVDKDGKTDEVYNAAITYEHLSEEQKATASNADLIARSYVKIIQGDTETIIYSAAEDTVRNMKAVAYAAIKSGKYEGTDYETNLYGYTGVTADDVVTNDTVDSFYSLNDKSGAINIDGMAATSCEVYYGARKLSSTLEGGVVTVSGLDSLEAGEGLKYELTVFAGGKIYNQAFGCATQVIDEAEDLAIFNLNMNYEKLLSYQTTDAGRGLAVKEQMPTIRGYYVLAGDINATAYKMDTQGIITGTYVSAMNERGFRGVFDGRGHSIRGLTLGNNNFDDSTKRAATTWGWNNNTYSLFGVIGKGAVVKNFAMTDVVFDLKNAGSGGNINSALCSPIATWVTAGATVENMHVSVKGVTRFNAANTTMAGFAYGVDVGATLKNIVVDDTNAVATDGDISTMQKRGSFVYRKMAGQNNETYLNSTNVVVISTRALCAYKGTSSANGYAYDASNIDVGAYVDYTSYVNMPGTYRYESVGAWETAQADATVTMKPIVAGENGFSTKYWTLVNGIPVWGKEVA